MSAHDSIDGAVNAENAFGKQLREHRTSAGVTLRALAKAVGCSQVYLSEVERGTRPPMRRIHVESACSALALSRSDTATMVLHAASERVDEVDGDTIRAAAFFHGMDTALDMVHDAKTVADAIEAIESEMDELDDDADGVVGARQAGSHKADEGRPYTYAGRAVPNEVCGDCGAHVLEDVHDCCEGELEIAIARGNLLEGLWRDAAQAGDEARAEAERLRAMIGDVDADAAAHVAECERDEARAELAERLHALASSSPQVQIGRLFEPAATSEVPPAMRLNGVEYNVKLKRASDTHVELCDAGDAWHDLWMSGVIDAKENPEWLDRFDAVAQALGLEFDCERKTFFARVDMPDTPTPSEAQVQACLDASEAICKAMLVVDGWWLILKYWPSPSLRSVRAANRRAADIDAKRQRQVREALITDRARERGRVWAAQSGRPSGLEAPWIDRIMHDSWEGILGRIRSMAAGQDELSAHKARIDAEQEERRLGMQRALETNRRLNRRCQELEAALAQKVPKNEAGHASLTGAMLRAEVTRLEAEVERLRSEHEAAVDEVVRLARIGEQARQEVERLRRGAGICATNRRPCDENQRALWAAQRRIEDLTREVHALESEVSRLRDAGAVDHEPTEGGARTGENAEESGSSASITNELGGVR